jgi:hypothetical protein
MLEALATHDDSVFPLLLIPLFLLIAIATFVWRAGRKKTILEQWADQQGFQLIDYEERWLARGPFFFTTAKGRVVYLITVQHPDGRLATGWAKCGSWAFGLLSDAVQVRWDEDKPQAPGFRSSSPAIRVRVVRPMRRPTNSPEKFIAHAEAQSRKEKSRSTARM